MSDVSAAVLAQYESNTNTAKKTKVSDAERLKLYFSTALSKKENDGQKVFRILPPAAGKTSPFEEVWFHELKIGDDWRKLYCPKKNKTGDCPLCDIERDASASGTKEDKEIASQYRSRKFYIVKGIDRGKEEDGPKFWRFRSNYKKQGALDKIIPIFSNKGDITDAKKGRDLIISLGKDDNGYTKITSIMPEDMGPLSEKKEEMEAWLGSTTTWHDVYAKQSFEYLEIIAQGEIPYWDKDGEKFITKTEWESKNNNGVDVQTIDDKGETSTTIGGNKQSPSKPAVKTTPKPKVSIPVEDEQSEEVDEDLDDLPF